ncbi:hypothetical protein K504DRAFT_499850 [Pleomassaria siparia CBS 279.74]|uniref:Glucose-methanol-choline oxidoreductase C-terminal domain-containing protein n=1 Tax=Pleomassaria siparia CBS 279.74 TaxID=1314801 RepID=A0A6G1KJW5_9PLEO|nr:hypothetical protein K504DRAFT_499850 [Pleomassaria siparia CBS 279.74]
MLRLVSSFALFAIACALPNHSERHDEPVVSVADQTYDYVIVGGGSAGLVVANRLIRGGGTIEAHAVCDGAATNDVTDKDWITLVSQVGVQSLCVEGLPTLKEHAAGKVVGAFWIPTSIDPGKHSRSHAGNAYCDPVSSCKNLKFVTGQTVSKILLSDKKATGVQSVSRGDRLLPPPPNLPPGATAQTDDSIMKALVARGSIAPTFGHVSSTASMLFESSGGVADSEMLVYGFCTLSVVDLIIIPLILATHLQTTMYTFMEKAADMIKERNHK